MWYFENSWKNQQILGDVARCHILSYGAVRLIAPLNCWQNSTQFWCKASLCTIKIDNFRTYHIARAYSTLVVLVFYWGCLYYIFMVISSLALLSLQIKGKQKKTRSFLQITHSNMSQMTISWWFLKSPLAVENVQDHWFSAKFKNISGEAAQAPQHIVSCTSLG